MSGSNGILTSDIVNFLVYRYLAESGFTHTAFTFGYESAVLRAHLDPNSVPPGSLVTFIQKGLQYLELEANIDVQDGEVEGEYKLLSPEELITNDIDHLRLLVQERKEEARPKRRGKGRDTSAKDDTDRRHAREDREDSKPAKDKDSAQASRRQAQLQPPLQTASQPPQPAPVPSIAPEKLEVVQPLAPAAVVVAPAVSAPVPMEEDPPPSLPPPSTQALEMCEASVLTLEGHASEVYVVAWSPVDQLLASGSGDATARIWSMTAGLPDYSRSVVLYHEVKPEKQKDVTTLDWNTDGTLLATGSYDGLARIWSKDGKLKQTLDKHSGPIFALRFNKKGDYLLSGSVDKTAIVWDARSGEVKQMFEFHSAPTLDVDWRNNTQFATCSTDKLIHVCKMGDTKPIKTFQGHEDEVNAIKWDPSGRFLASCSDDRTAKIWSLTQDKWVHNLLDHQREIYTIRWSPTGQASANPNLPLLLASASFDHTVRLWDAEQGRCVHLLRKHTEPVYSVAFSPNGRYVATGSFDKHLHVWSVSDGALVKTFQGKAGIYELCWSREGNRVAACFANRTVCVVDVRL